MSAYGPHDVLLFAHVVTVAWCYLVLALFYAWVAAPWVREPVLPVFLYVGALFLALLYFLEPRAEYVAVTTLRYVFIGALVFATGAVFKKTRG